jgi:hypothetical protein
VNILDTFFFVFEADTSGVKKGTDEGEKSAKKLKKAIDDVDLSADKLAANFVNMAKNAASALAGVVALGAIKALVNDTAAHTAAVALEARAMDMSVQTMSAYQASVVAMGGTVEGATATLGKLRDQFVEVARFGTMGVTPVTMAFQSLGASAQTMRDAVKDPTVALSAIADNFAKLSRTQQIFLGQKLGLDQGTIMLLSQGRRSFDELIAKERELHAITQEQADASIKYTIAQKELGMTFAAVKREIAQDLLPAFMWVVQRLDLMVTWLREHKAVAIATFTAIGVVVGTLLVPPLITAAAAMWALIAPVLAAAAPFIALGIAIGLVVDDIEKYRSGQKSLIGEIFEKWPPAKDLMVGVFKTIRSELFTVLTMLQSVWDYLAAMLEFFVTVWSKGPTAALATLNEKVGKIGQNLKSSFAGIFQGMGQFGRGLVEAWDSFGDKKSTEERKKQAASDARAGTSSATGRDIAAKLIAMGWTPEQAAGIAGNAMRESRGNPNAENSIGMYGLFQWDTNRRAEFKRWSGKDIRGSTVDEQLAFFNYEVTKGKEQLAGARIRAARTAEEAALATAHAYERYGNIPAEDAKRVATAQAINAGRMQIESANTTPLAQPGAISNVNSSSRSTNVSVTGPIAVHTQATDSESIAKTLQDQLRKHINNAIDLHDDGIAG